MRSGTVGILTCPIGAFNGLVGGGLFGYKDEPITCARSDRGPQEESDMKLAKYEGNPILSPKPTNAWESLVTTNPGA